LPQHELLTLRVVSLFTIFLALATPSAFAAEFDLAGGYAQSRDFWETVHAIQDQTGNIAEIQKVVHDRYGKPDVGYSYLDAAYSYPHGWFDSETLTHAWIGMRAEALAGGEISNPVFPEIQAYADTVGISFYGLHSDPAALVQGHSYWSVRGLFGYGPEKRLYAEGPELIGSIPVRSGSLLVGGLEANYVNQSEFGNDFWITTNALIRPTYFHSSVESAASFPDEEHSFWTWRWRVQNEWLKQVDTPLSSRTRFGLLSVAGQTPIPFSALPVTWDYQQKTQLFPGLGASSGLGGIVRLISDRALPNLAAYFGEFGGALGGGVDLQLGPVLLNASSYALENALTTSHDRTRLWQVTAGVSL
jgi:hypothetical protein